MKKTILLLLTFLMVPLVYAIRYYLQLDHTIDSNDLKKSISVNSGVYKGSFSQKIINPSTKSSITINPQTKVINMRDFQVMDNNELWNGQITGPYLYKRPKFEELTFNDQPAYFSISPHNMFGIGKAGESFLFESPVTISLQTGFDGDYFDIAFVDENGVFDNSEKLYCIVKNSICSFQANILSKILLYKKSYKECPQVQIKNGELSEKPYCSLVCDRGYEQTEAFRCEKQ